MWATDIKKGMHTPIYSANLNLLPNSLAKYQKTVAVNRQPLQRCTENTVQRKGKQNSEA